MARFVAAITLAGTIIGIFAGLKALEWPPFSPHPPPSAIAGTSTGSGPSGATTGGAQGPSNSAGTTGSSGTSDNGVSGPKPAPPGLGGSLTGCTLTITNPLVPLRSEPNPTAQEEIRVPPGSYAATRFQFTPFAGVNQRWFRIAAQGRTGWIQDTTIFIAQKSAGCP